jgi:hypothetical protein
MYNIAMFFFELEILQMKVFEKIRTNILCSNLVYENCVVDEIV